MRRWTPNDVADRLEHLSAATAQVGVFAWDEGEGDRTRRSWLDGHETYFRRNLPTIGVQFDPDMTAVFERFDVLYTE